MSAKRRRSKRVSKSERVMLSISEPSPVQDIVVTLEISQHGSKVLARRHFVADSRGTALFIAAGKQVPCRVAWQRAPGAEGRMETGLEIYSNANFWGLDLAGSEVDPEPALPAALSLVKPAPAAAVAPSASAPSSVSAMIAALSANLGPTKSASLPIDLWCALVDNLEAKGVFTRAELTATLKKMGQK